MTDDLARGQDAARQLTQPGEPRNDVAEAIARAADRPRREHDADGQTSLTDQLAELEREARS